MKKRTLVLVNYTSLLLMNLVFCYAYITDPPHLVDALGILFLVVTAVTFIPLHRRSGIWKLTHAKQEELDEREIKRTHHALSESYSWFTVICLLIILAQSFVSRMNICPKYSITVPLAVSLIYFVQTLPGSVIAWQDRG